VNFLHHGSQTISPSGASFSARQVVYMKSKSKANPASNIFKVHGISSLIYGSLWIVIGRILYYFISFITTSLITHALEPGDYGIILQFSFLLDIGTTLSLLSIDTALVRQVAFYKGKGDFSRIRAAFRASLLTTSSFSSLVLILYILYARSAASFFLNNGNLADLVILISTAIPFNAITYILLAFMSGFKDFKSVTLINTVVTLVNRTLLTYAVLSKLSYYTWALAIVVATLAYIAVAVAVLLHKRSDYLVTNSVNIAFGDVAREALNLVKFGLSLFSMNVARVLAVWSDNIIFPAITTLSFLSIVGLAKSVNGMINNLIYMISAVFLPYLSEVYASHEKEGVSYATLKITKISFFLYTPLFFFLVPLAQDFILFYAGARYIESAWILVPLLLLSAVHVPSYSTWTKSEIAAKRPIMPTKEALASQLSYIVSSVILIPPLGAVGFVLASLISVIPFWIYFYQKSSRDNIMKIDFTSMLKSITIGSITTLILYSSRLWGGLYAAILALIPCAIIYLNLAFLLGVISREEFTFIENSSPKPLKEILAIIQRVILF